MYSFSWQILTFTTEYLEMWKFSVNRDSNNTRHLYWYAMCSAPCYTGVEYCLFVYGYTTTFAQIN